LRKLGILRFGTKKYRYTSGRDMPAEALMDDVIDAKKDLLFDIDLNEKKGNVPPKEPKKGVKMWKKILGGLLLLIVISVTAVLWATSGMVESAESFFNAVKAGEYDKAYNQLSEDFKHATSKEQLILFLKKTGLDRYEKADWGNRSFEGNKGQLEGSIITRDGGAIPLTIEMVKAGDRWQIYSLHKPASGIVEEKREAQHTAPSLPDPATLEKLAKTTMHTFALSIDEKKMDRLYRATASLFRKEIPLEKLQRKFSPFIEAGIDLKPLDRLTPVFDPAPHLTAEGVLVLRGYYNTTPSKVYFTFKYIRENGEWKVIGINIQVR
jgi:hypothetical protein